MAEREARRVVSYWLLARALLGLASAEEAEEYHARGLTTDEVLLYVLECNGAGGVSLRSLLPEDKMSVYLDIVGRAGLPPLAGIPVDSLAAALILLASLADLEYKGNEGASPYRYRLEDEVVPAIIEGLRRVGGECSSLLAASLESILEDSEPSGGLEGEPNQG